MCATNFVSEVCFLFAFLNFKRQISLFACVFLHTNGDMTKVFSLGNALHLFNSQHIERNVLYSCFHWTSRSVDIQENSSLMLNSVS